MKLIQCKACGVYFTAMRAHNCKGTQDARERLLIASAAEWRLTAAIELLGNALNDVKSIAAVMPIVTSEHISDAKTASLIALSQIEATIKRMP